MPQVHTFNEPASSRRWGAYTFAIAFSLVNSLLFHRPLFAAAIESLKAWHGSPLLPFSTLFVLQFTVTVSVLMALSLLSPRLLKPACFALMTLSAIALYFIDSYGVVLDKSMMGNVFNTTWSEASQLFNFRLVAYVALLAVLPAWMVSRLRFDAGTWRMRVVLLVLTLLVGSTWTYANAKSWLWLDQNARRFGGLMLPWSMLANAVRVNSAATGNHHDLPLPPVRISSPGPALVVLVIGESARAQNFSLYGYSRQTNPKLANAGAITLPQARACATYTTASVMCMLSHVGALAGSDHHEFLPTYLQRQGVDVLWRSNNWGQPPLPGVPFESAESIRARCPRTGCAPELNYDEVLLDGLEHKLEANGASKRLVVLHQSGSHGPRYSEKYPPQFEVFKPVCRTVDLNACRNEELVNAYDNSVLYTDFFLARVIEILKRNATPSVMLYVSDHGESLGEFGLYLHGTPYALAPDVQKRVPFVAWTSESFARTRGGVSEEALRSNNGLSQDAVFHSVLGALGLESAVYRADQDIFHHTSP